jgi:hypothetical protein
VEDFFPGLSPFTETSVEFDLMQVPWLKYLEYDQRVAENFFLPV